MRRSRPEDQVSVSDAELTANANALVDDWLSQYRDKGRPLRIDIKKSVPWVSNGERATHLIHPYPAKMLRHIPAVFARSTRFSHPGDTVLDPFAGSGTALLEALLADRQAVGFDSNPLAVLITAVKTTPIDAAILTRRLDSVLHRARTCGKQPVPNLANVDYWYTGATQRGLARLRLAIEGVRDPAERQFLLVALSHCSRRVSRASPHFSVPVLHQPKRFPRSHPMSSWKPPDTTVSGVFQEFERICELNIARIGAFSRYSIRAPGRALEVDTRFVPNDVLVRPADLIITSPPYLGAQKYIRASSLNLGWLGALDHHRLREYEMRTIGREHLARDEYASLGPSCLSEADRLLARTWKLNPERAAIAATYLRDMAVAVTSMAKLTKRGGYLVLVIGANRLCGRPFATPEFVHRLVEAAGFEMRLHLIDHIQSRGLMTKRNTTAGQIPSEEIRVYRKSGASR
jgi:hypothetical protein